MAFHCTSLVFIDPDKIAGGIEDFFTNLPFLTEVHSVTVFTTAVEKKSAFSSSVNLGVAHRPEIQYQFRFVITYSTKN